MKRLVLKSAILTVATVLFSAAIQAQPVVMRFSVPFAFSADDQQLAAGDYILRCDSTARTLVLERSFQDARFLSPGIPSNVSAQPVSWRAKLQFRQYGNRYYLHSFERAGVVARQWPPSRAEREAAKVMKPREVAMLVH